MAESSQALATQPAPSNALGFLANAAATFEGVQRLADLMAKCGTMPAHLKDKPADCFRVVVQAAKWGMDPFAVAECTSLVRGKMCFEGKLVGAALQSMNSIEGRLEFTFEGAGQSMAVIISGKPRGGKVETLRGTVQQWRTDNGNWDKDPQSMLVYRGTRQWARLYTPDCMLGVYTPDEAEEIREVEAEVVHTDPPAARTGRPATEKPAEGGAQEDKPTEPAPPASPTAAHPARTKARDLYRALKAGLGREVADAVNDRLCVLHGAQDVKSLADDRLDAFGRDVEAIQGMGLERAKVLERLQQLENDAAEAAREAGNGGGK